MPLPFYNWSRTAASNATADATVNWAEGQSPSSVNDSARAMMASTAAFRDDISGAIGTGGTSTAYTVTSFEIFDSFTSLNGKVIGFTPHATNGGTTTLNVDGLGAKPLRQSLGVEIVAGTLIQGTPYLATYVQASDAFYLHDFYGNPYSIPIGGSLDFWGSTAPNSSFVLMYGQAISRSTYSALFSLFSTTYGTGDGSTTFNIPDLRGRTIAGKDDMGGSAQSRLTTAGGGIDGVTLGAVGGAQNVSLAANQIPTITASNSSQTITVNPVSNGSGALVPYIGTGLGSISWLQVQNAGSGNNYVPYAAFSAWAGTTTFTASNSISTTYTNASQVSTKLVQPTIIANKLLRII